MNPFRPVLIMAALAMAACVPKEAVRPSDGAQYDIQPEAETAEASVAPKVTPLSADPMAPLEVRAVDRWRYLIARDAASAYPYLTPGVRASLKPDDYRVWLESRTVNWTDVAYIDRTCENESVCSVDLQISATAKLRGVPKPMATSGTVTERWIRIDGAWYHLPDDSRR